METISSIFIGLIAFIHFYIFVFESFFWETRGPKVFTKFSKDLFPKTKALAFNQGVYNLFLSAGLLWTFFIEDILWQQNISIFFLGCVIVAGIVGASIEKKILLVQTLPALIGLILIIYIRVVA